VARDPVDEFGSLFTRDGERFVPTRLARGPWGPNTMHGGAPSALMAYVLARHDPGPASFVARLTVELLRPVPLEPMQVVARTFRPGKNVQWLEGALLVDDVEVVRAFALRLKQQPVDVADAISPEVVRPQPPSAGHPPQLFAGASEVGYWNAVEIRIIDGAFGVAGPASAWMRLRCPPVDAEEPTPFERVAAVADFGSGVGNPLTFTTASAINPEITIHTHRHPAGEWVCLQSGAWAESHGVGLADTRLFDEDGQIGRAIATLLISPIGDRQPPGFADRQ
jgi:Acyl-CoA thioesterase C-terminal domain/Acyl-CoA thioesterase N-terminal domain